MNHVSVIPMANTGGDDLSFITVSCRKGNFQRLSLPAAGDTLLPFNRSNLEIDSGNCSRGIVGELSRRMTSAVTVESAMAGAGTWGVEVLMVGVSSAVPLLSVLVSTLETPAVCWLAG